MIYNLKISERADELLDNILFYVAVTLSNPSAATAIADDVSAAYDRIIQFGDAMPFCEDKYLASRGFKKKKKKKHDYVILFKIRNDTATIEGIFHELEQYGKKI